jgi:hypothetical protein
MPPADGNAFVAAFVTNALCGAFPLLDFLAICLVQAMVLSVVMMIVGNVVCSLQSESWWFFLFCQSGTRALKISGHRSRTVIFVFLISIMSKSGSLS